jgi:pilus assembly protein Flp/PilA
MILPTKELAMFTFRSLRKIVRREEGQTLSEYALILVLIAVVAIVAITLLGNQISAVINSIANAL